MRFGFTSSASMLSDVSTATITSTPRRVTVSSFAPHCGRASARMMNRAARTTSDALMIRRSRLALVDRRLTRRMSPNASTASLRRRNERTNSPIRTGRAESHQRYSGAAKRIRPSARARRIAGRPFASWNLPQERGGQDQLHQDQKGSGIQKPRELLRVPGVSAHLDLGALHPVDGHEDLLQGPGIGGAKVPTAGRAGDLLQRLLVDVGLDVDVAASQDRIVDRVGRLPFRADADGVHLDPHRLRQPGTAQRIDLTAVIATVREQNDDLALPLRVLQARHGRGEPHADGGAVLLALRDV